MGVWIGKVDTDISVLQDLMLAADFLRAPTFENTVLNELIKSYKPFYQENGFRVPLANVVHLLEHTMNNNLQSYLLDMLIFAMSERTVLPAAKEGHLNKTVKFWIDQRAFVTQDQVKVTPWDYPENTNRPH